MADGRMLKKLISTSKKLPNLKTDSARLLYTWLIPHLDVKGRFSGEPDIVKGSIVPRLKNMDCEKIAIYLDDMAENDLIDLYEVDGDKYLELVKFNEFQTLRKDREGPSRVPNKDGLRDNSGSTPAKAKANEGKLNEANVSQDKVGEVKVGSSFQKESGSSVASLELNFYNGTCEIFKIRKQADRTTLQNVAKFLSEKYEFDDKIFKKVQKVAIESVKGNVPIALFMSRMKDEFDYRKVEK